MDLITPAHVRTRSKSRWHPSALDALINRGVEIATGIATPLAVIAGGDVIALVKGNPQSREVLVKPITHRQWCGFNSYLDLEANMKAGRLYKAFFKKDLSSMTTTARWVDWWPCAPNAGDYSGTAATARQFLNTTPGCLYLGPPCATGKTRHLAGWSMFGTVGSGSVNWTGILYDRVLGYDGLSITTSQTVLTNTLAATRYISAGQSGLQMMVTNTKTGALGATASNISALTYTDNDGNTGQSMPTTQVVSWQPSAAAAGSTNGSFCLAPWDATGPNVMIAPFLPLGAGDAGVRKIEDFTSSAANTGTVSAQLVYPMAVMMTMGTTVPHALDLARNIMAMERIYDDACLNMLSVQANSGSSSPLGWLNVACG